MPTPLMKIGDSSRPESLQRNLYKVNSPYDLTDDIVTRSLNLLQNITGYDYRSNPVLNLVERLVDARNSDLVRIGGERLLVEFGRRAGVNTLGKFIPSPTGTFKKEDATITKDVNPTLFDIGLQKTIGYRSNENTLEKKYKTAAIGRTSDINFFYTGDITKEKIQTLNRLSVFSAYNIKKEDYKINFNTQSLVFRNTYSEDYINKQNFLVYDNYTETMEKTYFDYLKIQKGVNSLTKDIIAERTQIEKGEGFGSLSELNTRETTNSPIRIGSVSSLDFDENAETNRQNIPDVETFRYDSNTSGQNLLNNKFNVKRGLIYFTSKLAQEDNSIIPQNVKQLFKKDSGNNKAVYWKGNGPCRTFTIYDQYDNFNRVIKFDGNNEKNSVLKESVLPRIAPMIGDRIDEKHRYFFTMENLAVKPKKLKTGDSEDCDYGPNGGKWMWFVPYNVKISDNNSVNWSDLNFLGRPEPVFSYQNTKRGLSLSFTLLIDTVKEMQDVEPTIQKYYNYIYGCDKEPQPKNQGTTPETKPQPLPRTKRKPSPIEGPKVTYFFKNDAYVVKYVNIDYTSNDNCKENDESEDNFSLYNATLSTLTYNNNFLNNFTAATKFLDDNIKNSGKIVIDIKGFASFLFTKKTLKTSKDQYNNDLGYRRGYDMFKTFVEYFNDTGVKYIFSYTDKGFIQNQSFGSTIIEKQVIDGCEVIFNITSKGDDGSSGNSTFANRNDGDEINDRRVEIASIRAYPKVEQSNKKETKEQQEAKRRNDTTNRTNEPCDPILTLEFEKLNKENKVPVGYEKLNTFTPSFNSQTPFDFTKRYVFLHQLTRPGKLDKNITTVDNIVFGRMPVFILRYGDFIHTKAIANSINFDIQDSTWDLNPEGMGVIPLICNVTMDLTLIGGQSLAGPIDRIQTANDSSFIANTSFNSGRYTKNRRFTSSRNQEFLQYGDKASGEQNTTRIPNLNINSPNNTTTPPATTPLSIRPTPQPLVAPKLPTPTRNQIIEEGPIVPGQRNFIGPISEEQQNVIDKDRQARAAQEQKEREEEEARIQSSVRINPLRGF
jgi:hypothetical protein